MRPIGFELAYAIQGAQGLPAQGARGLLVAGDDAEGDIDMAG